MAESQGLQHCMLSYEDVLGARMLTPTSMWWSVQGKMGLSKDADMSPFEAGRKLLALDSMKLTLNDRIDLVFQDADLVPLLVQVLDRFIVVCWLSYHMLCSCVKTVSDWCTRSVAVAALWARAGELCKPQASHSKQRGDAHEGTQAHSITSDAQQSHFLAASLVSCLLEYAFPCSAVCTLC